MNERLKELAEQAKIQLTKPTNYATALAADGQLKALEKFAELIIRECIIICKNIERYDNGQDEPETIGHIRAGAAFCREDIIEHFRS